MRYLFYLGICIFLVAIQTTVLASLPSIIVFYDLMISLVVYFSLYRRFMDGLPVVIIAGITMDMLSGAPLGVYLTTYIWVFVFFRSIRRYIRVADTVLFTFLVAMGMLFENCILWIAIAFQSWPPDMTVDAIKIVLSQLVWIGITTPFFLLVFHHVFSAIDSLLDGSIVENG